MSRFGQAVSLVLAVFLAGCSEGARATTAVIESGGSETPVETSKPSALEPTPAGTAEPAAVEMGAVGFVCFRDYDEYTYETVATPGLQIQITDISGPPTDLLDQASAQVTVEDPAGNVTPYPLPIKFLSDGGFGGLLEIKDTGLLPGDYHWVVDAITYTDGSTGDLRQPHSGTISVTEQQVNAQCLDG